MQSYANKVRLFWGNAKSAIAFGSFSRLHYWGIQRTLSVFSFIKPIYTEKSLGRNILLEKCPCLSCSCSYSDRKKILEIFNLPLLLQRMLSDLFESWHQKFSADIEKLVVGQRCIFSLIDGPPYLSWTMT